MLPVVGLGSGCTLSNLDTITIQNNLSESPSWFSQTLVTGMSLEVLHVGVGYYMVSSVMAVIWVV